MGRKREINKEKDNIDLKSRKLEMRKRNRKYIATKKKKRMKVINKRIRDKKERRAGRGRFCKKKYRKKEKKAKRKIITINVTPNSSVRGGKEGKEKIKGERNSKIGNK